MSKKYNFIPRKIETKPILNGIDFQDPGDERWCPIRISQNVFNSSGDDFFACTITNHHLKQVEIGVSPPSKNNQNYQDDVIINNNLQENVIDNNCGTDRWQYLINKNESENIDFINTLIKLKKGANTKSNLVPPSHSSTPSNQHNINNNWSIGNRPEEESRSYIKEILDMCDNNNNNNNINNYFNNSFSIENYEDYLNNGNVNENMNINDKRQVAPPKSAVKPTVNSKVYTNKGLKTQDLIEITNRRKMMADCNSNTSVDPYWRRRHWEEITRWDKLAKEKNKKDYSFKPIINERSREICERKNSGKLVSWWVSNNTIQSCKEVAMEEQSNNNNIIINEVCIDELVHESNTHINYNNHNNWEFQIVSNDYNFDNNVINQAQEKQNEQGQETLQEDPLFYTTDDWINSRVNTNPPKKKLNLKEIKKETRQRELQLLIQQQQQNQEQNFEIDNYKTNLEPNLISVDISHNDSWTKGNKTPNITSLPSQGSAVPRPSTKQHNNDPLGQHSKQMQSPNLNYTNKFLNVQSNTITIPKISYSINDHDLVNLGVNNTSYKKPNNISNITPRTHENNHQTSQTSQNIFSSNNNNKLNNIISNIQSKSDTISIIQMPPQIDHTEFEIQEAPIQEASLQGTGNHFSPIRNSNSSKKENLVFSIETVDDDDNDKTNHWYESIEADSHINAYELINYKNQNETKEIKWSELNYGSNNTNNTGYIGSVNLSKWTNFVDYATNGSTAGNNVSYNPSKKSFNIKSEVNREHLYYNDQANLMQNNNYQQHQQQQQNRRDIVLSPKGGLESMRGRNNLQEYNWSNNRDKLDNNNNNISNFRDEKEKRQMEMERNREVESESKKENKKEIKIEVESEKGKERQMKMETEKEKEKEKGITEYSKYSNSNKPITKTIDINILNFQETTTNNKKTETNNQSNKNNDNITDHHPSNSLPKSKKDFVVTEINWFDDDDDDDDDDNIQTPETKDQNINPNQATCTVSLQNPNFPYKQQITDTKSNTKQPYNNHCLSPNKHIAYIVNSVAEPIAENKIEVDIDDLWTPNYILNMANQTTTKNNRYSNTKPITELNQSEASYDEEWEYQSNLRKHMSKSFCGMRAPESSSKSNTNKTGSNQKITSSNTKITNQKTKISTKTVKSPNNSKRHSQKKVNKSLIIPSNNPKWGINNNTDDQHLKKGNAIASKTNEINDKPKDTGNSEMNLDINKTTTTGATSNNGVKKYKFEPRNKKNLNLCTEKQNIVTAKGKEIQVNNYYDKIKSNNTITEEGHCKSINTSPNTGNANNCAYNLEKFSIEVQNTNSSKKSEYDMITDSIRQQCESQEKSRKKISENLEMINIIQERNQWEIKENWKELNLNENDFSQSQSSTGFKAWRMECDNELNKFLK